MRNDLIVSTAGAADRADWEDFVNRRGDEAGYHAWEWQRVFENAFGHECVYLMARRDGPGLSGWLALSWLKARRTFPDILAPLDPRPEVTYQEGF